MNQWIIEVGDDDFETAVLQRSQEDSAVRDTMISYLPPAVGCAVANYLGNEGHDVFAIITVILVLAYIALVIKPYEFIKRR